MKFFSGYFAKASRYREASRRFASRGRRASFEHLEDRRLLAGSTAAGISAPALPALQDSIAATAGTSLRPASAYPSISASEGDARPAALGIHGSDHSLPGDYYWYFNEKIPLYREKDSVTIELRPGFDTTELNKELAHGDRHVSGLKIGITLDATHVTLTGSITNPDATISALERLRSVKWAAPSFINGQSGLHQWLSGEIIVALNAGVDAAQFFNSHHLTNYRPLWGTTDEFIVDMGSRGGLPSLRIANFLSAHDPDVRWAEPNFFAEISFDGSSSGTATPDP